MMRSKSKATEPGRTQPAGEEQMNPSPDEALATRAVQGDTGAFEALVVRYQDRVFNLLLRQTGSANEAEDLTQETFLKAYRALASFRQGSKFYTWLFRIAVNTGYSRGRQIARRQRVEGASLDAPAAGGSGDGEGDGAWSDVAASPDESAGERFDREHVQRRVQEGLARLDPEYRAVVLLRDMEGLDYDAIAEALETTRAAVKSRLHRARAELARSLRDLRPEGSRREAGV